MCPFNCFVGRDQDSIHKKNLVKNCGAPFGLNEVLVLDTYMGKMKKYAPFEHLQVQI